MTTDISLMEPSQPFDLSYLTEEERAHLLSVIDADAELRIQKRPGSHSSNGQRDGPQQLHLKLENDHIYVTELLRKSLTNTPADTNGSTAVHSHLPAPANTESVTVIENANEMKSDNRPEKVTYDELPEFEEFVEEQKVYDPSSLYSVSLVKSSSTDSLTSLTSVYSASAGKGDYDITGKVEVGVWFKDGQLFVHIMSAKRLKREGVTNPYMKIYLLPDHGKHAKRRTSIQRKTTNPVFDEILKIKVEKDELKFRTLWLSVWDWDRFGRNQFLGEVRLPLSSLDLTDKTGHWHILQEEDDSSISDDFDGSKLRVGLMYKPQAKIRSAKKDTSRVVGTLHVAIHQAEDLPAMDEHSLTDATVKLYLLPNQSSSGKRKTNVVNKNLNPVWDEQFTYKNVYMDDLSSQRVLEVTVWDYDRRGSNDFIGGLRIGPNPDSVADGLKDWMDSIEDEVSHWEAMLKRPGEWVERWHDLRPSMKPLSKHQSSTHTQGMSLQYENESTTTVTHQSLLVKSQPRLKDTTLSSAIRSVRDYDITGEVSVGVYHDNHQLHVHVDRARSLAAGDSNGYSDPYIKLYLLPDKDRKTKHKTSIKKKTLDPVFNKTFTYIVPASEVGSRTLWLNVWDWDRFSKNEFLGEIHIPLSSLDLSDTADHWYSLKDKTEEPLEDQKESHKGQLKISMILSREGNLKEKGTLHISLQQAKDSLDQADSTVALNFLPNMSSDSKTKKNITRSTLNSDWEEKFTFENVKLDDLNRECALEITVWNVDIFIGGLRFGAEPSSTPKSKDGMSSIGDEVSHWQNMLNHPGEWVEQWHTLRINMNPTNA